MVLWAMYVRAYVRTYVLAANGGDRVMYVNIGRCRVGMCGDGRIPQPTRACSTAAARCLGTDGTKITGVRRIFLSTFYHVHAYTYNYMCVCIERM